MKILAIDIGGTAIKYGITDENFNVCEFYEIPSEAKLGRDHLMLKVLSIVGTYYGGVDCVGISTAGQVNSEAEWSVSCVAKNLGGQLKAYDNEYERSAAALR